MDADQKKQVELKGLIKYISAKTGQTTILSSKLMNLITIKTIILLLDYFNIVNIGII